MFEVDLKAVEIEYLVRSHQSTWQTLARIFSLRTSQVTEVMFDC